MQIVTLQESVRCRWSAKSLAFLVAAGWGAAIFTNHPGRPPRQHFPCVMALWSINTTWFGLIWR